MTSRLFTKPFRFRLSSLWEHCIARFCFFRFFFFFSVLNFRNFHLSSFNSSFNISKSFKKSNMSSFSTNSAVHNHLKDLIEPLNKYDDDGFYFPKFPSIQIKKWFPPFFPRNAHKGQAGKIGVVGGSFEYTGKKLCKEKKNHTKKFFVRFQVHLIMPVFRP
jgi:hypothetical protein